MPVTAIVGGQWGDEGKGKVVDTLARHADVVVRYNGGNNAGHTIQNEHGTFRLHLLPSGIFHPAAQCVIGPGVVVNPDILLGEVAEVERVGMPTVGRVWVSDRAHLIFPHHIVLDELEEAARGGSPHGTTKQGIWPVYADKAARIGIRMGDMLEEGHLAEQLAYVADRKSAVLREVYGHEPIEAEALIAACRRWTVQLRPYIVDTHPLMQEMLRADRMILLEGQLGVMRDLDWGLYPFVTSSTTLPGGACAGAGIPPYRITRVLGVTKAYTTAVGSGPMPTEAAGPVADRIRDAGQEFGATTAVRLVRRRGRSLRGGGSRVHASCRHESGRLRHLRDDPAGGGLPPGRPDAARGSAHRRDGPGRAGLRRAPGMAVFHPEGPALDRSAARGTDVSAADRRDRGHPDGPRGRGAGP
jgi:adenylosuccinate synthase